MNLHRLQKTSAVLTLLLFPILIWLSVQAKTNTQDLNNWIDQRSSEADAHRHFTAQFGNDDEIFFSWEGCTTDDLRLSELTKVFRENDQGNYYARIINGAESLKRLTDSASRFSNKAARTRLRGSLFGNDLKTTCVVIRLADKGIADRAGALQQAEQLIADHPAFADTNVHSAGRAVASVQLNRFTNQSLKLGVPGAALAALLAFICVRELFLVASMVYVAGFAAAFSLALVPLTGFQVNGLLVLLPVLVFVLTLSCAVHQVRALKNQVESSKIHGRNSWQTAIDATIKIALPPITLAMITTAVGFSSLCLSTISAVRQFGGFTAVALVVSLLLLRFVLPGIWRIRSDLPGLKRQNTDFDGSPTSLASSLEQPLRLPWLRFPRTCLFGVLLFVVPAVFGLTRFQTDLNVMRLFDESTKTARDFDWIEENLFPLGRVEFVIRFPKEPQFGKPPCDRFQQLMIVRKIHTDFRKTKKIHSALSLANFVKLPRGNAGAQRMFIEQAIASQIEMDLADLERDGILYSDRTNDYWRLSVACKVDEINDEQTFAELLKPVVAESIKESHYDVDFLVTGIGPLAAAGQRKLFGDLIRGLALAILLITPLIIFSLRDLRLGLLAMIPNLFPIVIVFGYFGLFRQRLDVGAVLTASVGLGIAIDDTVHFLHYFRIGKAALADEVAPETKIQDQFAVAYALRHCSRAILTTTLILCGGMSFFCMSEFVPVRNFATCLILMMGAAAIADLIMLPALIIGLRRNSK